ncbi:MAG: stage II sporulation protein R [Bacillota bacterium]|jgi:stage II sporulation protein R
MRKKIIYGIMIAMLLTVGIGGFSIYQNALESPLRLHVIANSDSSYDQEVKLFVRDQILDILSDSMADSSSKQEAIDALAANLPQIEERCNEVLKDIAPYSAQAKLEVAEFPSRKYRDTVLPAGEYDALRVVLGDGKGKNWWCVLFPPLCLVDLAKDVKVSTSYSPSEDSIPVSGNKIQIRLKFHELFGR